MEYIDFVGTTHPLLQDAYLLGSADLDGLSIILVPPFGAQVVTRLDINGLGQDRFQRQVPLASASLQEFEVRFENPHLSLFCWIILFRQFLLPSFAPLLGIAQDEAKFCDPVRGKAAYPSPRGSIRPLLGRSN